VQSELSMETPPLHRLSKLDGSPSPCHGTIRLSAAAVAVQWDGHLLDQPHIPLIYNIEIPWTLKIWALLPSITVGGGKKRGLC
jgi:hypothetical protein